jgi:mersacidin/lichenicidin family type 2 lantibiotic
MSNRDIIRAWKDEDYRLSLSEAERALLPEHPAGLIEVAIAEMDGVGGGRGFALASSDACSWLFCPQRPTISSPA